MSHKPEHIQNEIQNISPPFKRYSFLRRPGILVGLIILVGGGITFIVWTFPRMSLLSSPNRTFLTYAIVFAPTIFTILIILLGFLIWWAGAGYERRGTNRHQNDRQTFISTHEHSKQQKRLEHDEEAEIARPLPSRRSLTRHATMATLKQKRKRKFYKGREYKGKIHQTDLRRITLPLSSSSLPLSTQEKARIPLSTQVEVDPGPAEAKKRKRVSPGPNTKRRSPDYSPMNQGEHEFTPPSYETMEIPAKKREPFVSIYLLKELTVEVQNEHSMKKVVQLSRKRREDGKYTERELLAYLASWRGQPAARDKLLESVFAYGLSDEKYTLTNLTSQFNKCTQFLRQDINKVAATLEIPTLTIISSSRDEWRLLTEECRVVDLDEVERQYSVIAELAGDDCLKPSVQTACQLLIDVYKGDFL